MILRTEMADNRREVSHRASNRRKEVNLHRAGNRRREVSPHRAGNRRRVGSHKAGNHHKGANPPKDSPPRGSHDEGDNLLAGLHLTISLIHSNSHK